jgi:hypothetical protein
MPIKTITSPRGLLLATILIGPALLANVGIVTIGPQLHKASAAGVYEMRQIIEDNWQDGDIVYHMADGTYINMLPYSLHPQDEWHVALCGTVRGSLSPLTRSTITGRDPAWLADLAYTRAWVLTSETPLNPICEAEYIQPYIDGLDPVICIRDDALVTECLYLVGDH